MGGIYEFLSKHTLLLVKFDYLLAPFSAASFHRTMARRFTSALVPVAAVVMLAASIGGAGLGLTGALERLYLLANGVSTQAAVEKVETEYGQVEWKRVNYVFTARTGERISGSLRRQAGQLRDLGRGSSIEVLYVGRRPQINLPRRGFDDLGKFALMILLSLGVGVHPVLMMRRYWTWLGGTPTWPSAPSGARLKAIL